MSLRSEANDPFPRVNKVCHICLWLLKFSLVFWLPETASLTSDIDLTDGHWASHWGKLVREMAEL